MGVMVVLEELERDTVVAKVGTVETVDLQEVMVDLLEHQELLVQMHLSRV
jgi:hypothetical protein